MSEIKSRSLDINNPDFDSIKLSLINFLKEQDQFADYNFEGSNLNVIMDLMTAASFWNIFNANIAVNESFLDTAQLRPNVVSKAKTLGYTPSSAISPTAYISFTVLNAIGNNSQLSVTKGLTFFKSNIDGNVYNFYVAETTTTDRVNDEFIFLNVAVKEGFYKTFNHFVDTQSSTYNLYKLPDLNSDITTLTVRVLEQGNIEYETYFPSTESDTFDKDQLIYFVQESRSGLYEVSFGDNLVGKGPGNNAKIELNYIVTNKKEANSAGVFSIGTHIENNTEIQIDSVIAASGGAERESIKSIKFNAPLTYTAQNRAVTASDYKSIIQSQYSNIEDIDVWGGQDNDPPEFGKVFIVIKPLSGDALLDTEKDFILNSILKPKSIVLTSAVILDPTFTYIHLEILYKYNSNLTDLSVFSLSEKIRAVVVSYNNNDLKKFDGVFRYSNLLSLIDVSDPSIVSTTLRTYMEKRIEPDLNNKTTYTIVYSSPLSDDSFTTIKSSLFTYSGTENCYFEDYLQADGVRKIKIVALTEEGIVSTIQDNIGVITPLDSKIVLNAFQPDSIIGDYIWIRVVPNSYDIAPKRSEMIDILTESLDMTGDVDTMVVGGTNAGVDYETFPKNR